MDMSQRIKERRLAMNFTQEELAYKLGLQKSAIAKYENGRVENIKRSVIAKMAEALKCSPAYLMGWEDDNSKYSKLTAFHNANDNKDIHAKMLLEYFYKLNDSDKASVLRMTKALAENTDEKGE